MAVAIDDGSVTMEIQGTEENIDRVILAVEAGRYVRIENIKPRLTPHFFRHNYVTLLYESGVDPLIAMKIVGHTDYQTTANIYTHVRDEMLKKATVNMNEVFQKRTED